MAYKIYECEFENRNFRIQNIYKIPAFKKFPIVTSSEKNLWSMSTSRTREDGHPSLELQTLNDAWLRGQRYAQSSSRQIAEKISREIRQTATGC